MAHDNDDQKDSDKEDNAQQLQTLSRSPSQLLKREEDAREVLIVSLITRLEEMERQMETKQTPNNNINNKNSILVAMLEDVQDTVVNLLHPRIGLILFPFVFCLWTICAALRTLKRVLYL